MMPNPQTNYLDRVTLRPAQPEDDEFLYELYCSTRYDEIAAWGLSPDQQQSFFELQFRAQRQHYALAYEELDHQIIEVEAKPFGRILIHRSAEELVLVDIALLPSSRGKGIGALLIQRLKEEAKSNRIRVSLHVEKNNPALRLYERLGFRVLDDDGVYFAMEWRGQKITEDECSTQ